MSINLAVRAVAAPDMALPLSLRAATASGKSVLRSPVSERTIFRLETESTVPDSRCVGTLWRWEKSLPLSEIEARSSSP
jgi:hypothetical protein